jgi:polyhydroxybutyrate depolymerase
LLGAIGLAIAIQACRKPDDAPRNNPSQLGPGDHERSLVHQGLKRHYKIHVPNSYSKDKPIPLVVYVHGGGGNRKTAFHNGIDRYSEKYGFLLAAPEGTGEVKLGQLRASWNGGKWESGECCGNADDVGFIAKMLDEIEARFNVDKQRIYATGLSNGGLMTNRLACDLSSRITAIATVAPAAIKSDCRPSRAVPYLHIHGTGDPANPPDGSAPRSIFGKDSKSGFSKSYKRMTPYQVVAKWRAINGCSDAQTRGYEHGAAKCVAYKQCRQGATVELCLVEGMGHTYPAGHQYLPASIIGPVSTDISFDQIWKFFQKTSRP